jgi:hypothetical protein
LNLANDSQHLAIEPTVLSLDSGALAGAADVGAGESAADDVNEASPGSAVEGADVIPDWESGETSVTLSCEEHPLTVLVDLDGSDRSPSK